MKDNSKLTAIILVIVTVVVVVGTFIYNKITETTEENKIEIVVNYSDFYTVNSCLYRVITYLGEQDNDSMMKVLYDGYKKDKNINSEKVISLFPKVDIDSTFTSMKMYYQEISSNITKYYVYGRIYKNQVVDEQIPNKQDYLDSYFIVYLDSSNKTFSIEPYSGEIFINGDLYEQK